MPEIPTWAELRERHLCKAGGAEDMSSFDDMSKEAQKNPQMPEQPWFIHVNSPRPMLENDHGIHDAPGFDPDKFKPPTDVTWSEYSHHPQYYPNGGAFVSRENSGFRAGSTGYLDSGTSFGNLKDSQGNWNGWKVRLDPAHHQVLGDRKAYEDFLSRYSKPGPKGASYPDWDRLRDDGIYSLEFPKSYFDSYISDGLHQSDMPSVMTAMGDEPQAFIIDPRAVMEQAPWSMKAPTVEEEDAALQDMLRFKKKVLRSRPKL